MEHEPLDLCSPFVTYLYNRKEDKRGCSLLVFQHTHKKTGGKLETDFDIFTLILLFPLPLGNKPFENTVGKGEFAGNEQFLLFPQCFFTHLDNFRPFSSNLKLSSAHSFSLEESKICCLVMDYISCNGIILVHELNSLPNNKILDKSKLKAFADNNIISAKMMIFVSDRVENIVGKEKMLVTSIFSYSHNVFKRILSLGH